jgi:hypothetical protein
VNPAESSRQANVEPASLERNSNVAVVRFDGSVGFCEIHVWGGVVSADVVAWETPDTVSPPATSSPAARASIPDRFLNLGRSLGAAGAA